jgi:hypothetical protein
MDIPSFLKTNIQEGKVVLMLGAGASMGAVSKNGDKAPSGKQLGVLLANRFLGGNFVDYPLNQIAELAISESDPLTVQEYIREILEDLVPTEAHKLLCQFNWYGLATTNYDTLVEKAYATCTNVVQIPVPFVDNNDRIEDKMRSSAAIPYLKLHGCITRTNNAKAPLILTTDQYVQYKEGRKRVFSQFEGWCYEHIIVFVGYTIQDPNLRHILLEIEKEVPSRPKYYMVVPDAMPQLKRFWEKKNIDIIDGTFDSFMKTIDSEIGSPFSSIKIKPILPELPISERFIKRDLVLSANTRQFLETDVEYVKAAVINESINPQDFYRGMDLGWSAIQSNLDVKRKLGDSILVDHFLDKIEEIGDDLQFILIKAHAGAGKKTLLRRIAWDASHDYNCLCLYLKPFGRINSAAISELIDLTNQRVFLFVEDIPNRIGEMVRFFKDAGNSLKALTITGTARTNEWNVACSELSEYVTHEHELKYLSPKDIEQLLALLERHNALGTLKSLDANARKLALMEHAGRQLLVALHEATLGKSFIEIIRDEYNNIRPYEAQKMYLSVCILNRFGIPVRAGIISRIHGISFTDFKQKFFAPLELIIRAEYNKIIRDYEYTARHSHIAEIVFENILDKQEEKFTEYTKCIRYLNISYESDRKTFYRMIRASELMDEFNEHSLLKKIYEIAYQVVGENHELYHQMGIYEMKRVNGNLSEANRLLEKAYDMAPNNHTVIHSIAELKYHLAENARTELEFAKYINEAQRICLDNARILDSYGYCTLLKSELLKLEKSIQAEPSTISDGELEQMVKSVEEHLEKGLQTYSGDTHLLNLETKLAKLMSDSERVLRTLNMSFALNPRNAYVALRLARCYQQSEDLPKAQGILTQALDANSKKELHYAYGKLLLLSPDASNTVLEYHFKRGYAPGDKNYDAQLLHARQLYLNGEREQSIELFKQLRYARISFELRGEPRYPLEKVLHGEVIRLDAQYYIIRRDGISDTIYCNRNENDTISGNLNVGMRVQFKLAFNMYGPTGIDVIPE